MYQQQFVEYKLRRSGIPALEYRVRVLTSQNRVKSNCDVIANFLQLGIFNEHKISELHNLEILYLFNNAKIPSNVISEL